VLHCLLFREIQQELFLQQLMHIPTLYVRNICVDHEGHKIEDEICALPKNTERGKAEVSEPRIVLRVYTTHSINHLFANLDGGWVEFRVVPKYVAKVNMEEMT
jgi:hypothetical protein